ncbi:hypothetical protein, partial [Bacillus pumilus]
DPPNLLDLLDLFFQADLECMDFSLLSYRYHTPNHTHHTNHTNLLYYYVLNMFFHNFYIFS